MEQNTVTEQMTDGFIEQKITEIAQFLAEKKGEDIIALDLHQVHAYLNYFIIVTASSGIHAKSLVRDLKKKIKNLEIDCNGGPNEDSPEWIVVDCFWLVIHIFLPEARAFYSLDKLWADARHLDWS